MEFTDYADVTMVRSGDERDALGELILVGFLFALMAHHAPRIDVVLNHRDCGRVLLDVRWLFLFRCLPKVHG